MANRHPWIFDGSIEREQGPATAAIADLFDRSGRRIASGFYSMHSQIRMRALTFGDVELTRDLIRQRIQDAISRRSSLLSPATDAVRMVHSEGDDLSGLVVDRYRDDAVIEITSAGFEQLKSIVVESVNEHLAPRLITFKNNLSARKIEKLPLENEVIGNSHAPYGGGPGTPEGDEGAAEEVLISENGLRFVVDSATGQKTGFFLDQRENRAITETHAYGRNVLNLFSYSGAFGVYAARGGARSVDQVDVSGAAIRLARRNHELNGQLEGVRFINADAFEHLRVLTKSRERYGLIICDPPAFAKSRGDVDKAGRGYKDVNLHALKLVESGGYLMTFSCSGHISTELFQKIIFSAALDAGREVSIVKRLGAGADHPVSIYCPESEYLKGFLLQVH